MVQSARPEGGLAVVQKAKPRGPSQKCSCRKKIGLNTRIRLAVIIRADIAFRTPVIVRSTIVAVEGASTLYADTIGYPIRTIDATGTG